VYAWRLNIPVAAFIQICRFFPQTNRLMKIALARQYGFG
jgi:hypothetical protein